MRFRTVAVIVLLYLVAIVVQTTLFGRITVVTPDLVMLVSILLALTRIRPEAVLGLAFASGLIVDLLGSSLLGLRAIVFSVVAYIAVRTRERAEVGRLATALWAGVLSLIGVALIILPHAYGAPQPADYASVAPEALAHRFIVAVTITSLLFWLSLGTLTGFFYKRVFKEI